MPARSPPSKPGCRPFVHPFLLMYPNESVLHRRWASFNVVTVPKAKDHNNQGTKRTPATWDRPALPLQPLCSLDTSTLHDSITNQGLTKSRARCFDRTRRLPAQSRNQESEVLRCPAAGDDGQPGWLGWLMGPAKNGAVPCSFFHPLASKIEILQQSPPMSVFQFNQYRQKSHSAGHSRGLSFLSLSSRPAARSGICDISMVGACPACPTPGHSWRSRLPG